MRHDDYRINELCKVCKAPVLMPRFYQRNGAYLKFPTCSHVKKETYDAKSVSTKSNN